MAWVFVFFLLGGSDSKFRAKPLYSIRRQLATRPRGGHVASAWAGSGMMATLSAYTKLEKIGRGSYGEVFKVRRHSDGTTLVLKEVSMVGITEQVAPPAPLAWGRVCAGMPLAMQT